MKHSHAFLFHACSMILWWSQSCKASWSRVGYLGIFGWIFSTKPWILYVLRFPCRHLWIFSWLCWAQAAQESSLLPVQPTKRSWFWNHKDFPHGFREVFSHDSSHTNLNVPPIWLRWKKKFHGLNRLNPKIPFLIPQTKIPKKKTIPIWMIPQYFKKKTYKIPMVFPKLGFSKWFSHIIITILS